MNPANEANGKKTQNYFWPTRDPATKPPQAPPPATRIVNKFLCKKFKVWF